MKKVQAWALLLLLGCAKIAGQPPPLVASNATHNSTAEDMLTAQLVMAALETVVDRLAGNYTAAPKNHTQLSISIPMPTWITEADTPFLYSLLNDTSDGVDLNVLRTTVQQLMQQAAGDPPSKINYFENLAACIQAIRNLPQTLGTGQNIVLLQRRVAQFHQVYQRIWSYINAPERALYNRLIVGAIQLYTGFLVAFPSNYLLLVSRIWFPIRDIFRTLRDEILLDVTIINAVITFATNPVNLSAPRPPLFRAPSPVILSPPPTAAVTPSPSAGTPAVGGGSGPVLPAGSDTTTTGAAAAPTTASGAGPIVGAGGTSATPGAGATPGGAGKRSAQSSADTEVAETAAPQHLSDIDTSPDSPVELDAWAGPADAALSAGEYDAPFTTGSGSTGTRHLMQSSAPEPTASSFRELVQQQIRGLSNIIQMLDENLAGIQQLVDPFLNIQVPTWDPSLLPGGQAIYNALSTNLRQAVQGAVLPGSNLLNALANPAITNGLSNLADAIGPSAAGAGTSTAGTARSSLGSGLNLPFQGLANVVSTLRATGRSPPPTSSSSSVLGPQDPIQLLFASPESWITQSGGLNSLDGPVATSILGPFGFRINTTELQGGNIAAALPVLPAPDPNVTNALRQVVAILAIVQNTFNLLQSIWELIADSYAVPPAAIGLYTGIITYGISVNTYENLVLTTIPALENVSYQRFVNVTTRLANFLMRNGRSTLSGARRQVTGANAMLGTLANRMGVTLTPTPSGGATMTVSRPQRTGVNRAAGTTVGTGVAPVGGANTGAERPAGSATGVGSTTLGTSTGAIASGRSASSPAAAGPSASSG